MLAIFGAIGLVVLAAASSNLTAASVQAVWDRADPAALVLAFILMTTGLVFLALRWRAMMTERDRVQVWPLTGVFVTGTLLHYVLPGPIGELATAGLAARRFRIPVEMAFAAGIHARFLGLALAGAVSGILFLTTDLPVPAGTRQWVGLATAAITFGAVGLGVLSAFPAVLRAMSAATVGRVRWLARLDTAIARMALALQAVGQLGPRRYAWGALWALCGHGAVIAGIEVAARGLGATPNPAGLAFTYAVTTAGAVVLFGFPGAQVGWDAMFASLLVGTAGLALPDALAITLLVRAQQLFTVLLGGIGLLRVTQPPPAPADERGDDSGPLIG